MSAADHEHRHDWLDNRHDDDKPTAYDERDIHDDDGIDTDDADIGYYYVVSARDNDKPDDNVLSASERDFIRSIIRGISADYADDRITDDDVLTAVRELIDYCSDCHVLNGNDVANWPLPFYPSYVTRALAEHAALN